MLGFFKKIFGTKPTVNPCPDVPYKVETPAVSGTAEKATEAVVASIAPTPTEAPKAKAPKAKKPAGAKKPRAPRKPKQPK